MAETTISDVLFLGICALVPLAMAIAVTLIALRKLREHAAFRAARRRGWELLSEADLRAMLPGFPPLAFERIHIRRSAARESEVGRLVTCTYYWRSGGPDPALRTSRHEAWLIVPVPHECQPPRVVVALRGPGALERLAGTIAASLGGVPHSLPPAWSGLRVAGPGDGAWFTDARGTRLTALLGPGETLWLHDGVAVLTVPAPAHTRLMSAAEARARAVLDAMA